MHLQYEDEIKWLKRQIESAGGVVQPRKDGAGMPSIASKVEGTQSSALPSCFGTAAGVHKNAPNSLAALTVVASAFCIGRCYSQ